MTETKFKVGDKIWVPFEVIYVDGSCCPYDLDNDKLALEGEASKELEEVAIPLPVVRQFVAEWYEENKHDLENSIANTCVEVVEFEGEFEDSFRQWFADSPDAIATLILMDKLGYEKEKRYIVRILNVKKSRSCLIYNIGERKWYFKSPKTKNEKFRINHTKKELEDAGFGWVFEQGFAEEVEE